MSLHNATVAWALADAGFTSRRYSRAHVWHFDGGATVPASSSPHVVPVPYSDAAGVDPEEAYVAALASCHMLWFLDLAARGGLTVESYRDEALGQMEHNAAGQLAMTRVTLRPHVVFAGQPQPDDAQVHALHHRAHEACFLANSVKTLIETRGTWSHQGQALPATGPAGA